MLRVYFKDIFRILFNLLAGEQGLNHGDHTTSRSERDLSDYMYIILTFDSMITRGLICVALTMEK